MGQHKALMGHTVPGVVITWAAVLDGDERGKVLRVVAQHYGILVALGGRPVQGQVDATHVEWGERGTRFHTSYHTVCEQEGTIKNVH